MNGSLDQPPVVIGVSYFERRAGFQVFLNVFLAAVNLGLYLFKGWPLCLAFAVAAALSALLHLRALVWPNHAVLSRDGITLRVRLRERLYSWSAVASVFVEKRYTGVGILDLIPVVELREPGKAPRMKALPPDMDVDANQVRSLVEAARERWG